MIAGRRGFLSAIAAAVTATPSTPRPSRAPEGLVIDNVLCPNCQATMMWPTRYDYPTVDEYVAAMLKPREHTCEYCRTTFLFTFARRV